MKDGAYMLFMVFMGRKKNDRSFEDQEGTLEEIKSLFFKTLYLWIATNASPFTMSYSNFFVPFAHMYGA